MQEQLRHIIQSPPFHLAEPQFPLEWVVLEEYNDRLLITGFLFEYRFLVADSRFSVADSRFIYCYRFRFGPCCIPFLIREFNSFE